MGGMERYFGLHIDPKLGHGRTKTVLPKGVEGGLVFPGVDVVTVGALPPSDVRVSANWRTFKSPNFGSNAVVLFERDSS